MKLTRQIPYLYLSSAEGHDLWVGFAQLAGLTEDEEPEEPTDDEAEDGDESTEDDSSESEELTASPLAQARMLVEPCFAPATFSVEDAIDALKCAPPRSAAEARELYDTLLSRGVQIQWSHVLASQEELVASYEERFGEALPVPDDGDDDEPAPDHEIECIGGEEEAGAKAWASYVPAISWALHTFAPERFFPYAFAHRFHDFEALCADLGIPLPVLPGKAGYLERARYYLDVNEALQEFRSQLDLEPAAFNAFIYGFGEGQLTGTDDAPLPAARRIWFLMGNEENDFDTLDEADDETRSHWQGNYDVRPGDICLMWCRSPRSYVHSIWRATSRGFADPFFYYYRTIWIGHPVKVPPVSFRELEAEPVWSQKPATRARFQNSSGKEVTTVEYEALLRILAGKGFDVARLPQVERIEAVTTADIDSEREVEEKLLEPMLRRVGYKDGDWVRQLPVRMGRGERVYPDYVIGLTGERGEESASLLVEAKHHLLGELALREAYLQARSYAERLQVATFVLSAIEGVWVFERGAAGFCVNRFEHFTWAQLSEATRFRVIETVLERRPPGADGVVVRSVSRP